MYAELTSTLKSRVDVSEKTPNQYEVCETVKVKKTDKLRFEKLDMSNHNHDKQKERKTYE